MVQNTVETIEQKKIGLTNLKLKTFIFIKNQKFAFFAAIFIFCSFLFYLIINSDPKFPENIPHSEDFDISNEIYQTQQDFFRKYTRYLQDNYSGIFSKEEFDKNILASGKNEYSYVVFRQRYKFLHKAAILDLTNKFAQQENIQLIIKTNSSTDSGRLSDYFEIEFQRQNQPWIRVLTEAGREHLKPALRNSLNENSTNSKTSESNTVVMDSQGYPRLVVIIDDLGNRMDVFNKLILLDFDITYSILPQQPNSRITAEMVDDAGREAMLHLPMQPKEWSKFNPGAGALLLEDDPETIMRKLESNLEDVPYALGVNNHMGSAFTQYAAGLDVVMEVLSERVLFFLDSKTAPGRIAKQSAAQYQVPYLSRDIFLDNEASEPAIKTQLFKAVNLAKKRGYAIAIGHPYPETYNVLANFLTVLAQDGIRITTISELLN